MLRAKRVLRGWRCDAGARVANAAPRRHMRPYQTQLAARPSPVTSFACPPNPRRTAHMAKFTFDHIHLFTRDPEATAGFYERMFGAEVIRSLQQGKPRIDLKLGGANIFILDVSQDPKAGAGPGHPHQGLDHFG